MYTWYAHEPLLGQTPARTYRHPSLSIRPIKSIPLKVPSSVSHEDMRPVKGVPPKNMSHTRRTPRRRRRRSRKNIVRSKAFHQTISHQAVPHHRQASHQLFPRSIRACIAPSRLLPSLRKPPERQPHSPPCSGVTCWGAVFDRRLRRCTRTKPPSRRCSLPTRTPPTAVVTGPQGDGQYEHQVLPRGSRGAGGGHGRSTATSSSRTA